jgi:P4 family phage/plasmid primase-like protien
MSTVHLSVEADELFTRLEASLEPEPAGPPPPLEEDDVGANDEDPAGPHVSAANDVHTPAPLSSTLTIGSLSTSLAVTSATRFEPQHLEYMRARAIEPALAWTEGVRSLDETDARRHSGCTNFVGGGLAFAYGRVPVPYTRVQLDDRVRNEGKTRCPPGVTPPPYIPSTVDKQRDEPLVLVEAPAKALALVNHGFPNTIGCAGVDAGFFAKGTDEVQPVLLPFLRPSRPVLIVFDAGRTRNPRVARAEARIARALLDLGCPVSLVALPFPEDGGDGPDDFLARQGARAHDAMAALVAKAHPACPVAFAERAVAAGVAQARRLLEHLPFVAALVVGGTIAEKKVSAVLKDHVDKADIKKACAAFVAKLQAPPPPPGAPASATRGPGERPFLRGDEVEVAERHLEKLGDHAVFAEGSMWRYRDGVWHPVDELRQLAAITLFAGAPVGTGPDAAPLRMSSNSCQGALRLAEAKRSRPDFFTEAPRGLAFANGFLGLDGDRVALLAHDPAHRARFRYAFVFDRAAACPRWLSFLAELWQGDIDAPEKAAVLQEFIGASLFGLAPRFKKAIMLHGDTDSGKSTLLDVIMAAFPKGTTRSIGFHDWDNDYCRREFVGALLNTVAEVPNSDLLRSESFKAIVAGDPIKARSPFERPFFFRPVAGHIFAANTLPRVNDRSEAVWGRFILLKFERRFFKDAKPGQARAQVGLAEALVASEVPGTLAWAVEGVERLLANGGRYTVPASSDAEVRAWKRDSDKLESFFDDEVDINPAMRLKSSKAYAHYLGWCERNGVHQQFRLDAPNFGKQFRRVLEQRAGTKQVTTLLHGYTVFLGVALRRHDPKADDPREDETMAPVPAPPLRSGDFPAGSVPVLRGLGTARGGDDGGGRPS